jgi:threonine/homoserine/homoserine lactone efflux protein
MMNYDISLLISGCVLGLTAGLSPGPLQALVISQTLKHGLKEGIMVSLTPLMTDLPIIIITSLALSQLADIDPIMGLLSFMGALFLAYLAYGNLKITGTEAIHNEETPDSIKKGIITNFLNPYPYMFWLFVGAPLILKAYQSNLVSACAFLLSIYVCLIGTFMSIAGLTEKSRTLLKGKIYIYTIRFLGILLLVFSLRFAWDGLKFLGMM